MAILVASGFIELGLYSYPRHLIEGAGRQFYWSLLGALLLGFAASALLTKFCLSFPHQAIMQVVYRVLGRPIGLLVGIFLIAYHAFLAAICLRYFADLVNVFFLPRTPPETVMYLIVLCVVFMNWQGFAATVRSLTLTVLPVMSLVILAFLMVVPRMTEVQPLIPVSRFYLPEVLEGICRTLYLFVGIESIVVFMPLVNRLERPYFWALLPMLINGLMMLTVLLVTLGIHGIEPVLDLQYPGVAALRVLRMPGMLVERTGGMVALTWTALKIGYLSTRFLTVPMTLGNIFGISAAHYRLFLIPFAAVVFALARWPRNSDEVDFLIQWVVGPVGLLNLLLIIVLLLVGKLRRMVGTT